MSSNQFTGSGAEVWYKTEKEPGVLRTGSVPSAGDSTLSKAVNPGDTAIEVKSVADFAAGDTIAVGTKMNQEMLRIKSVTVSQKKITLDDDTPLNFRHEAEEAVVEADPTADWFSLGSVTSFTPRSDRPLEKSQAFGAGVRGVLNARPGRYEFGADITVEMDIEAVPLWLLHALNDNYVSTGTAADPAVATTVATAAESGAGKIKLAAVTGIAADDFLELGGKEIVKVKSVDSGKKEVAFSEGSSPLGIRYAYAAGAAVRKVVTPFTHTIVKGHTIPAGMSLLLRLVEGEQESLVLLTGNRINTLSLTAQGGTTIPTVTLNMVATRGQVLAKNIFGTPTKISHIPYAQWETAVSVGDSAVRFNSLSLEIQNNVTATAPLGSPLPGAASPGEGSVSGSFEYEYRTQEFARATATGKETSLGFLWTYIGDANHSLKISLPKVRLGGAAHPAVTNKEPINDSKDFTALVDSASMTDIKIVARTTSPSVEYLA